jgi:enamine deaminase RidA (YjgF/YER057c/UK114 family)
MRPEWIRPTTLYQGPPYEYGAIAPEARLVFTAGACPLDAEGRLVGPGDLEVQAQQALDNLLAVLADADSGPAQLLKTTVFVVTAVRSDLVRAWDVISKGLGDARPPSTLLGVTALGYPEQLVEIEAVALTSAAG